MIKAAIVAGEPTDRERLVTLLSESPDIERVVSYASTAEAYEQIATHAPHLLFLDIQVSIVEAFRLLGMLSEELMPHVVFLSSNDHEALKTLEEKDFDYLLKPVDTRHLAQTLRRVEKKVPPPDRQHPGLPQLDRIPCTCGNRIKLIDPHQVEYIHSDLSGVHLFTPEGSHFTELTLKHLEQRHGLFRCHKQYLVNLERVAEIILMECGQAEIKTEGGQLIPVSRRYLRALKDAFQL